MPKRRGRPVTHRADPDEGDELASALLTALKKGEASSVTLGKAVGCDRMTVRRVLKPLAAKGLVHETGKTANQRWHLGAAGARQPGKPAKEAP
jgi:predicted ArsR family transcriptional regulator